MSIDVTFKEIVVIDNEPVNLEYFTEYIPYSRGILHEPSLAILNIKTHMESYRDSAEATHLFGQHLKERVISLAQGLKDVKICVIPSSTDEQYFLEWVRETLFGDNDPLDENLNGLTLVTNPQRMKIKCKEKFVVSTSVLDSNIILLDDIATTCESLEYVYKGIRELGGIINCFIVLGRTVRPCV